MLKSIIRLNKGLVLKKKRNILFVCVIKERINTRIHVRGLILSCTLSSAAAAKSSVCDWDIFHNLKLGANQREKMKGMLGSNFRSPAEAKNQNVFIRQHGLP